jgi:hypothetical protein
VYEIKNLRRELLRRRHRAVDAFMTRIDHLNDFQPDSPKSATPNKTRKVCP